MNFFDMPNSGYGYPRQQRGYGYPSNAYRGGYGGYYDEEEDYSYQQRLRAAQEAERRQQLAYQRQREEELLRRQHIQQQHEAQKRAKAQAYQQALFLKKQREQERLAAIEAERQRWLDHINDPDVQNESATLIQSLWRGKTERRHRIIERLRRLKKEEERINNKWTEEDLFITELSQKIGSLEEMSDADVRRDCKRLLAFEEGMTRELLSLDGFSSGSSDFVRAARKELVNRINSSLSTIDTLKKTLFPRYTQIESALRAAADERARIQEEKEKEEARLAAEQAKKEVEEAVEPDTMEVEPEVSEPIVEEPPIVTEDVQIPEDVQTESQPLVDEPKIDAVVESTESEPEIMEDSFEKIEKDEYSDVSREELIKRIEQMKREILEKDNTINSLRNLIVDSGRQI